LPILTGLRCLAALTVLVQHGWQHLLRFEGGLDGFGYWISTGGQFGMSLFFVLSGFVIHYNYRHVVTGQGPAGLAAFLWARFSRLYPLYLFMLLLDLLLGSKLFLSILGKADGFGDLAQALPYHLLMLQSWLYMPLGQSSSLIYATGNGISWSISTEWFFYLAYPLMVFPLLRLRRPAVLVGVLVGWCLVWGGLSGALADHVRAIDAWGVAHYGAVAGLASGMQDSFYRWLVYFSPYSRVGEFILGCLVAQLNLVLRDVPMSGRERRLGGVAMALAFLTVLAILYLTYSTVNRSHVLSSLQFCFGLAPSAAAIVFCGARYDPRLFRWLSVRPMLAVGEATYSLYLLHATVLVVISSYLGWSFPGTLADLLFLGARFLFVMLLIVLLSLGLHAFLEVPCRRWLRGLWRGRAAQRFVALPILAAPFVAAGVIAAAGALVPPSPTERIHVLSATYGGNCGAPAGNATREVLNNCENNFFCTYRIDVGTFGDPKNGCGKDFTAAYECGAGTRLTARVPPEAGFGSLLHLACPAPAR
jgi:hypothetical protein